MTTATATPQPADREPASSAGDVRVRRIDRAWTLAFWIVALAVLASILWLARYASWWADDWKLIFDRLDWNVHALFDPHWGHPVVAPVILWKVVFSTIGLTSYLPFLAFVGIAHVLVAGGTFTIVRRLAGGPVGFGAGLVVLLLGSGGQAIVVPAALNLTGALAAGIWALAIYLDRPGRRGLIAVTLLLVLAVAFSGAGLYAVAIIGLLALLQPGRRRELAVVLPALGAFLVWRWAFDRAAMTSGATKASVQQLVDFTLSGASHAIGSITGLGDAAGLVLLLLLSAATAWHLVGRRPLRTAAIAGFAGIIVVYGVTALARASIVDADGTQASEPSRYIYLAAPFLLIACAAWLDARGPVVVASVRTALPVFAVIVLAILINAPQLRSWSTFVTDQGNNARAMITVVKAHAGSPALPLDARLPEMPDLFMSELPTAGRLLDVIAQYGSPADPDPLTPDRPPLRPETLERVTLALVHDTFVITPDAPLPVPETAAPTLGEVTDATTLVTGGCVTISPTGGAPVVTASVPGGTTLALTGPAGASAVISLSADGTFSWKDPRQASLTDGRAVLVTLPDLDSDQPWSVRFELPGAAPSQLCSVAPT